MSKEFKTIEELNELIQGVRAAKGYHDPIMWAVGRVFKGRAEGHKSLSVNYAHVNFKDGLTSAAVLIHALAECGEVVDFSGSECVLPLTHKALKKAIEALKFLQPDAKEGAHKNLQVLLTVKEAMKSDEHASFCASFIFEDAAPKSVESVYLKLYALSLNLCEPRTLNLDGAFSVLPNVAWDENARPIELWWLRENEIHLKMQGRYPRIISVDKFPRYLSHVVPPQNVRILDDAKVRLGAYISAGTTVMPGAAYVNFNAGTTGSVMIEGRVSSSVVVGEGSDIGGGASILGVLSGTNGNAVSIGKHCLLGANSVAGIPLGDRCIVDAGIAILEGTKVFIAQKDREALAALNPDFAFDREIYKGLELAGLSGLHFRQNSQSGQITASVSKRAIKLNAELH